MRTKEEIAAEIWKASLQEAACISAVGRAANLLFTEFQAGEETGTDGSTVFYHADSLLELYTERGAQGILRLLFHMLFHVMYLHLEEKVSQGDWLFHLACDMEAEYTIECLGLSKFTGKMGEEAWEVCRALWGEQRYLSHSRLYGKLKALGLSKKEGKRLGSLFYADSHKAWKPVGEEQLQRLLREAGNLKEALQSQGGFGMGRRGSLPGKEEEWYAVQKKRRRDYHALLRDFFVEREEMQLDLESFQTGFYLYGIEHYGNLPLLEPLEYMETRKAEELVIAIDTSSSCKEKEVQRFLEETWGILSGQENFFKKVRIHILQCDCYVQEDVCVTCRQEWEQYLKNMKIQGRGGTDFRPVFAYIEKLTREGSLGNLKGLLYFTDGDGIYPEKKPYYETVFLLAKRPPREARVPKWARLLKLPEYADSL